MNPSDPLRRSRRSSLALVTLPCALLLLPMGRLYAQQSGYQQNDPYAGQYAPAPQGYPQSQQYAQQPYAPAPQAYEDQQGYAPQAAQPQPLPTVWLSPEQLDRLVAPIALYPDTLVAQVLTAATYPAQVVGADHWRQSMAYAPPEQIVAGADAQPWDPSVKALTAFPQVLAEMDQNLQWATDLGNAYYNQPQDVLNAVQILRQRAQQAGTLQSTPQEQVGYDQGFIELASPNPQMVYVPVYNPWNVYGQSIAPYQGFSDASYSSGSGGSGIFSSLQSLAGSSAVRYGLGMALSAFGKTNWGGLSWALNWLSNSVLFHNSNYSSRSTSVAHWNNPYRPNPMGQSFAAQRDAAPRPADNWNRGNHPNDQRPGYAFNRTPEPVFAHPQQPRPVDSRINDPRFNDPRANAFRGNPAPAGNQVRPALQAYNRPAAPPLSRPQSYMGNPQQGFRQPVPERSAAYGGYGYQGRPAPVSRPAYPSPLQGYRAPEQPRGYSESRYANPYQGRQFQQESRSEQKNFAKEEKREEKAQRNEQKRMAKEEHSHSFGGGHESRGGHGGGGGGHFGGGHALGMFHR